VDQKNKIFCKEHFQIEIIEDNYVEFMTELYKECQKKGIVKEKSDSISEEIQKIEVAKINEYLKQYDLISDKLISLEKAHTLETDAAVKFKLKKQIEEEKKAQKKLDEKLSEIEARRRKHEEDLSLLTQKEDE
jgi:hypothetical protein